MFDSNNIQNILQKETTRREFLTHTGLAMATAVGVSAVIKNILQFSGLSKTQEQAFYPGGYGVGGFSGVVGDSKLPKNFRSMN